MSPLFAPPPAFGFARTPFTGVTSGFQTVGGVASTWFYRLPEGGTITKVRTHIGVQSGNVAVAAYANSGVGLASVPGIQLGTSGSVACPAVGVADIPLIAPATLAAGDWLAIAADNITATLAAGPGGFGGSPIFAGQSASTAVFPPPAPAGAVTISDGRVFSLIGVP